MNVAAPPGETTMRRRSRGAGAVRVSSDRTAPDLELVARAHPLGARDRRVTASLVDEATSGNRGWQRGNGRLAGEQRPRSIRWPVPTSVGVVPTQLFEDRCA